MTDLLIIFAGTLAAIMIIGWLAITVLGRQRRLNARVERIGERARPMSREERQIRQLKRKTQTASPFIEGLARHLLPRPQQLRYRLQRTGYQVSLGRYFLISLGVGVAAAFVCRIGMQLPWFAILAAAIVAGCGADVVVNGMVGSIGLAPTMAALHAGSQLALANKESLIVGGQLVHDAAEHLQYHLMRASVALAKERGPCDGFADTKYADGVMPVDTYKRDVDEFLPGAKLDWDGLRADVLEHGLRHSTFTAQMPSESSSVVSNETNGIEPPRDYLSVKKSKKGVCRQRPLIHAAMERERSP